MLFCALIVAVSCLSVVANAEQPPIWPLPTKVVLSDDKALVLDQGFKFSTSANYGSVIARAMDRYLKLISPPVGSTGPLKNCNIVVVNNASTPIVGGDETYSLAVSSNGCEISANTVWGALRGLESFTHFLVRGSEPSRVEVVSSSVSVTDSPRFGHRGMLIDTARHYLSVSTIQTVIDALTVSK